MSRRTTKQRRSAHRRNQLIRDAIYQRVAWVVEAWDDLLRSQDEAPDYPYEGQPYAGTWGAQAAREQFWQEIADFHGDDFCAAARKACGLWA